MSKILQLLDIYSRSVDAIDTIGVLSIFALNFDIFIRPVGLIDTFLQAKRLWRNWHNAKHTFVVKCHADIAANLKELGYGG